MKKITYISLIIFTVLSSMTSCLKTEEDDIFDKSAAERLNEASSLYSQRLLDSKNGWAMEYYPQTSTSEDEPRTGVGYLMLVQFNSDYSVRVGMNNQFTDDQYAEDTSAWEVITDNGPVLSFNTYNNCLHAFSNPEDVDYTSTDETGRGMQGDYEFVMVEVPEGGDYIMLKGKKRGTYSRLTRLSENTNFEEYINDVKAFQNDLFSSKAPNYDVMTIGGKSYNMIMAQNGGDLGLVKMWPSESDSTFTKTLVPMLITRHVSESNDTTYNVRFRNTISGDDDTTEQEFIYNKSEDRFIGVTDENNTIVGATPFDFLVSAWENGSKFQIARTSSASESMSTIINNIYQGYKDIKYTFQNIQLYQTETGAELTISYKTNKSAAGTVRYEFSCDHSGDVFTLSYQNPYNDASTKQMETITAIKDLVNAMSASFKISAGSSTFNLSTLKFTNTSDSNSWVVFSYVK